MMPPSAFVARRHHLCGVALAVVRALELDRRGRDTRRKQEWHRLTEAQLNGLSVWNESVTR